MSTQAVIWSSIIRALEAAGKNGATSRDLVGATKYPLHSLSGVLSSKWRSGDVNVKDQKTHTGVYLLPQFGGQKFAGMGLGSSKIGKQRRGRAQGKIQPPRTRNLNGAEAGAYLQVSILIGGRYHSVSLKEAKVMRKQLNDMFSDLGVE